MDNSFICMATIIIPMLSYFTWLVIKKKRIEESLAPIMAEVMEIAQKIEGFLDFSSGYFMKKDYDELLAVASPLSSELLRIPEYIRVRNEHAKSIETVIEFCGDKGLRESRNVEFKQNELRNHREIFDDIDGKSLDSQQRDAIVTDEFSNLVIAGAGSGKTLTVVGKIKYLVERWGVDPSRILVTSFTRSSVNELDERIKKVGIKGVNTKTFHAIGLGVLGDSPNSIGVANENELNNCVKRYLKKILPKDREQIQAFLLFYGLYSFLLIDYEQLEEIGEHLEDLKTSDLETLKGKLRNLSETQAKDYRTFHGERVKSLEELRIANFLFLHNVEYEYEKVYLGDYERSRRAYQPDFFLPEHEIWLEHFGLNSKGRAPWIASEIEEKKYIDGVSWKRQVHSENQTTLIESFSFWGDDLIPKLSKILTENGVELDESYENLFSHYEQLMKDEHFSRNLGSLIATFISLYKANNTTFESLNKKAELTFQDNGFMLERYKYFVKFVEPIVEYYKSVLKEKSQVDFDDMINLAAERVRGGHLKQEYDYIIVDEYQDISRSRFELIEAMRDHCQAKLVCVGDDWQSIYRFAGSDVTLFTSFELFTGYHELLKIENTYRNSQQLIDLAGNFIMKNTNQVPKSMKSVKSREKPLAVVQSDDQKSALGAIIKFILDNREKSNSSGDKKILILGRHKFDIESIFSELKDLKRGRTIEVDEYTFTRDKDTDDLFISFENYSQIEYKTVHRAKGLESDDVIVLNLVNDIYGFPNKIIDDPLLNLLLADEDGFLFAEERRLLYVAITRTKNSTYLITPSAKNSKGRSRFVKEIIKEAKPYSLASLYVGEQPSNPVLCPRCGTGALVVRESGQGKEFLGCTNYPFCERTYNSIEILESQVKCPSCKGWMARRVGRFGEFYGCTNYPDCTSTINIKQSGGGKYKYGEEYYHYTAAEENLPYSSYRKESKRNEPRCPKCGSSMRVATGRYGNFYSCSRYPSCKGSRDIS